MDPRSNTVSSLRGEGKRVVVLCPMQVERKAVERALHAADLNNVEVIQTGIGKDAIVRAVDRLAHPTSNIPHPILAVLAGACGGLAPVQDVPRIARIIDTHEHEWRQAGGGGGVTLVAVDEVVSTPAQKQALAARTGASVVDMESHAFCAACERLGIPWAVVRGVSDSPDESLPAEVIHWLDAEGNTRTGRAVADLLLRPRLIGPIRHVLRRSRRVLPMVGQRVAEIIRERIEGKITPLPVDWTAPAPLVIFFGGTFDPPHRGHINLPVIARAELEREAGYPGMAWLVYVPAARSPLKENAPEASDADRVEMLRRALEGVPRVGIWLDELQRADLAPCEPSYTVDSLRRARRWLDESGYSATKMRLLIGADQAAQFEKWKEPREIERLAPLSVLGRSGASGDPPITMQKIDVSGTDIRAAIHKGGVTLGELERHVPPVVAKYIFDRRLYR